MASALIMWCPRCDAQGPHHVVRTSPRIFFFDEWSSRYFQRTCSSPLLYRLRGRRCATCGVCKETVEFGREFLGVALRRLRELEFKELQSLAVTEENFGETVVSFLAVLGIQAHWSLSAGSRRIFHDAAEEIDRTLDSLGPRHADVVRAAMGFWCAADVDFSSGELETALWRLRLPARRRRLEKYGQVPSAVG